MDKVQMIDSVFRRVSKNTRYVKLTENNEIGYAPVLINPVILTIFDSLKLFIKGYRKFYYNYILIDENVVQALESLFDEIILFKKDRVLYAGGWHENKLYALDIRVKLFTSIDEVELISHLK